MNNFEKIKAMSIEDCNCCKMPKKYVIRNCPALCFPLKDNPECSQMPLNECCKDITDCVLKQIVNECKWETNIDADCRGDLAERILSEFEIEEVNEN